MPPLKDFLLHVRRQVEKWPHINGSNIGLSQRTGRIIHAKTDLGRVSENLIDDMGARVLGTMCNAHNLSLHN